MSSTAWVWVSGGGGGGGGGGGRVTRLNTGSSVYLSNFLPWPSDHFI